MNAPRDPWDQGGSGQQPDQPGPRYYPPPGGQQTGPGQPPSGWGNQGSGGPPPAGYGPPYADQPTSAYGAQPGYAYNPYGSPYAAGSEAPAPSRPGLLVLALIMQILAALPFLFVGIAVLVVPLNTAALPPSILENPQLVRAGATPELLVSVLRGIGVFMLVVALVYLLFAVLAFGGRNWARILVAVLSAGFALLLLAGLVQAGGAADTLLIFGVLLVLLIGSVVLSFLPAANAWYSRR